MSLSIPMAALLALAATGQPPPDPGGMAAAVAPIVGDEVAVAVHLNLARWSAQDSSRRILGRFADAPDVAGAARLLDARVDALKKAGATDLFLLVDLADMPGYPLAVVPMAGGADGRAIAAMLSGAGGGPDLPVRWPAVETIRGAVVAGTPGALARVRDARPAPRPELVAALAAGGDAPIRIAIIPGATLRRSIEESMPSLPPQLGGGPIATLSRGMDWASIALATEPRPALRLVVKAKDEDAARALRKIAQDTLQVLARGSRSDPALADLADAIDRMKPDAIGDRVALDADLEMAAALVSVPIGRARESARRSQCVNNLKQIGLAMHNYHSAHGTFPPPYIAAGDGKPLLSWRVMMLPYIEQKPLYDQFHLDEPWDSPHNKALIPRMPVTYFCPSGSKAVAGEGKTTYLAPRGPATIFPGPGGVKIQDITDGTSNTIFALDAGDDLAVVWTRPADWEVAPPVKIQGLLGHHPGGSSFLYADGSVRFLKETISPETFQALMTRNGGEVISSEDR